MRGEAALVRTGLKVASGDGAVPDTRIHVDLAHLRRIGAQANRLSFLPRQPARSALNGRHASHIRGRGLNFEELRDYLPGDDVRSIDWKVTARTGSPHVRVFTEERDRPALIVVDQRMSMFLGSRLNMKSVTAAEMAALAAFRILDQGDRVGGIVFGAQVIAEIRPQRSRAAVDRLLSALVAANRELRADAPPVEPMRLNRVLQSVVRIARRDHLIICLSDFGKIDDRTEILLGGLARHNDVVLGFVTDPMADELPPDMKIVASDGALQAEIDTGSAKVRQSLADLAGERLARLAGWTRKYGIPVLPLSAGEETVPQMRRLFGLQRRR
ncbi:MAG: DUF58 domain-containing protein [Pseudomonadota bacterium]